MDTKERIKIFINFLNINVSTFERTLKVSNGYVNSISKGIGGDKLVILIENFPDLNVEWLLTVKGNMLKSMEGRTYVNEPEEKYGINYKELYWKECYTVELQKKLIAELEEKLGIKRNTG
ncbi:hypothetical protein [Flavobacterium sp. SM2513]|uniref:hypothetical protein n=1 Tax=Flavobacterium sp. SM2513 TaxID=3424766 RepID=UPI003D7FEE5A